MLIVNKCEDPIEIRPGLMAHRVQIRESMGGDPPTTRYGVGIVFGSDRTAPVAVLKEWHDTERTRVVEAMAEWDQHRFRHGQDIHRLSQLRIALEFLVEYFSDLADSESSPDPT